MIVYSTPSSITWQRDAEHKLTLLGEWTLEPKFYLSVPAVGYWDGDGKKTAMSKHELRDALASLQMDAKAKGWIVEFDSALLQK